MSLRLGVTTSDASADALSATVTRRRLLEGLALAAAGPIPATATGARRPALRLGLMAAADGVGEALACDVARHLARRWPAGVALVSLAVNADPLAWCRAQPAQAALVLGTAWRIGAAVPKPAAPGPMASLLADRPPLALLACDPLVFANRAMPRDLAGWLAAARADPKRNRWGADAADGLSFDFAAAWLRALGVGDATGVRFRGRPQLLPALAGDRLALTVQTLGEPAGAAGCALPAAAFAGSAGNHARLLAMHRDKQVHLLAVADHARLPGLPGLPTLDEAAGLAGWQASRCHLLAAAPDLPDDCRQAVEHALDAAGGCRGAAGLFV